MKYLVIYFNVAILISCKEKTNDTEIEYYKNGSIKSIQRFSNGKINGQAQWFYPNGNIQELVSFENGNANGNAYYFYETGALSSFRIWHNDKMVGYGNDFHDDTVWKIKAVLMFNSKGHLFYKKSYDINGKVVKEEGIGVK